MTEKTKILIDTDVYNEIDDQFALCYALANSAKLDILGFTIAPFRDATKPNLSIRDGLIDSKNETNPHFASVWSGAQRRQAAFFWGAMAFCRKAMMAQIRQ